jgi:GDP-mannose 6-dehydrogenase
LGEQTLAARQITGESTMKIAVFGLGYVGCVSAACLANDGHAVLGIDVNPLKVESINAGRSPIIEPGLDALIEETVGAGRLRASLDSAEAIAISDVSLVCVSTPSNGNGSLKLDYVKTVCAQIGEALGRRNGYHTVVVRSTVLPGTVRNVLIPILEERSGKRAGVDFGVAMNPEFLRESSAIKDYYNPSVIVIGAVDERSSAAVAQVYANLTGERAQVDLETAELVKYTNNAFHALKVTFANEIGNLAKAHGIDGRKVMDILTKDHQLNISPAYLRPGFAFGGSCLPKDLRALLYRAKERDVESPLLGSLLPSNQGQIERGIRLIEATGSKKVAVLGLSFKAGTDDVRESPLIPLIETLVGRGYQVRVYDENVHVEQLIGSNKSFLEREIPHIASLMGHSLEALVSEAEVIVVGNGSPAFQKIFEWVRPDQRIVDLVGIDKRNGQQNGQGMGAYEGICW